MKNDSEYLKILENLDSVIKEREENAIKESEKNLDEDPDRENNSSQNDFSKISEEEIKMNMDINKIDCKRNFNNANLNSNIYSNVKNQKNNLTSPLIDKFSPIQVIENYSQNSLENKKFLSSQENLFDTPAKKDRFSNQSNHSIASKPVSNFSNKPSANDYKKIVICKHCEFDIILTDGKNFICCQSPFCKGKRIYCKLCKGLIEVNQLKTHFPKGPYLNTCIDTSKIKNDDSLSKSITSLK